MWKAFKTRIFWVVLEWIGRRKRQYVRVWPERQQTSQTQKYLGKENLSPIFLKLSYIGMRKASSNTKWLFWICACCLFLWRPKVRMAINFYLLTFVPGWLNLSFQINSRSLPIPDIGHKYHKWDMWRKICHVEKFQIYTHDRCGKIWNFSACGVILNFSI